MIELKLCSNSEETTIYRQMDETSKKSFFFDKRLKRVYVNCTFFILKDDIDKDAWRKITDESNKYSCKYGYWQNKTLVALSIEEIDFIKKTSEKLFGKQEG